MLKKCGVAQLKMGSCRRVEVIFPQQSTTDDDVQANVNFEDPLFSLTLLWRAVVARRLPSETLH
jgi:hypothetical protein